MFKWVQAIGLAGSAVLVGGLTACGPGEAVSAPATTSPSGHGSQGQHADSGDHQGKGVGTKTQAGTDGGAGQSGGYARLQSAFDGATPVDASSYPGAVTDVGFRTYNGDETCGFTDDSVICQMTGKPSYAAPKDCDGGGLPGLVMKDGEDPRFKCMGDVESGGAVIKDALTISVGDLQCVSRSDGVTCIDGKKHGFRLGTQSYALAGTPTSGGSSAPPAGPTGTKGDDPTTGSDTSLAGRYFATLGVHNDDIEDNEWGVAFIDDEWAYWGRPKKGMPTCTKVTGHPDADELYEGHGCVHYTYDADSGKVTIGSLHAKYDSKEPEVKVAGEEFLEASPVTPGARFAADAVFKGYRGDCGMFMGCTTWKTYLSLDKTGHFILSKDSTATFGGAGYGTSAWSTDYGPKEKGRYTVLPGYRIKLAYASGKTVTRTFASLWAHKESSNPSPPFILGTHNYSGTADD